MRVHVNGEALLNRLGEDDSIVLSISRPSEAWRLAIYLALFVGLVLGVALASYYGMRMARLIYDGPAPVARHWWIPPVSFLGAALGLLSIYLLRRGPLRALRRMGAGAAVIVDKTGLLLPDRGLHVPWRDVTELSGETGADPVHRTLQLDYAAPSGPQDALIYISATGLSNPQALAVLWSAQVRWGVGGLKPADRSDLADRDREALGDWDALPFTDRTTDPAALDPALAARPDIPAAPRRVRALQAGRLVKNVLLLVASSGGAGDRFMKIDLSLTPCPYSAAQVALRVRRWAEPQGIEVKTKFV